MCACVNVCMSEKKRYNPRIRKRDIDRQRAKQGDLDDAREITAV